MALLDEKTRSEIRRRLAGLEGRVRVRLFAEDSDDGGDSEQMLREVAGLCPGVVPSVHFRLRERELVRAYDVDRFPAFVIEGASGTRLRFFGRPAGFCFGVFFEGIKDAARGRSALPEAARRKLPRVLPCPVRIEVFVTPDCPLGPMAARGAQRLAVEVPGASADMIQAQEFPDLVRRYRLRGVPAVVLNGCVGFQGAPSETTLAELVLRALSIH